MKSTGAARLHRNAPFWLNFMYLPALLLFLLFIVYPFLKGIQISFTNWNGFSQTYKWIGFDNYKRMFSDPNIGIVIRNTLIYGVGSTLLQNIFGLLYALLLNKSIKIRGLARTIVYLPVIVSGLIMGYIFYFFFQFRGGAFNDVLELFGMAPVNMLGDPDLNVWIIMLVNSFQFMGTAMIIYLAGLQSISKDYFEAADIDGANAWVKFKNVMLPLLMPSITINVVLNLIGGLKLFDAIMALTGGGPGYASQSMSTMMYKTYFSSQDAGYASSIGILMFLMISFFSIFALQYLRRKEIN